MRKFNRWEKIGAFLIFDESFFYSFWNLSLWRSAWLNWESFKNQFSFNVWSMIWKRWPYFQFSTLLGKSEIFPNFLRTTQEREENVKYNIHSNLSLSKLCSLYYVLTCLSGIRLSCVASYSVDGGNKWSDFFTEIFGMLRRRYVKLSTFKIRCVCSDLFRYVLDKF